MTTAVLIPYRESDEWRDRALRHVLGHYGRHHPDLRLSVAACTTEAWSKGEALRRARGAVVDKPTVLVCADADCLAAPDQLAEAVKRVTLRDPWVLPFDRVWRLDETATRATYNGAMPEHPTLERGAYRHTHAGGIVVLRASIFDDCPMDPRFAGWGSEDTSWGYALNALHGEPGVVSGVLWHLWHPPARSGKQKRNATPEGQELAGRYEAAKGKSDAMRQIIGEFA